MQIPIYQLDAFADRLFGGNPAAVCVLEEWLPDAVMQAVAAENNLSETAFILRRGAGWAVRWFTPAVEVELCGHATLASAKVVFDHLAPDRREIVFETEKAGALRVTRDGDLLALDFPARPPKPLDMAERSSVDLIAEALGRAPTAVLAARDYLAVFDRADDVLNLRPDMTKLTALPRSAVIVTAPGGTTPGTAGHGVDFVSRFFAPAKGVDEDPVTGSAHCTLIPYWAGRLGRTDLRARQLSARRGELHCAHWGDRVTIAGRAVLYLEGMIRVP
jgi:PhzF family phenazine biosynthesis protein